MLIDEPLPSRIRRKLNELPFTPKLDRQPRQLTATEKRQKIRARLRRDLRLSQRDLQFLEENPEHKQWLERNLEPRIWSKVKSQEAEWQPFLRAVANGAVVSNAAVSNAAVRNAVANETINRDRTGMKRPDNCTEMWDCECVFCSD